MAGEKDKITGRVKQAVGDLTDDDELTREGEEEESAGKAKDFIDKTADKAKDTVDKVKEKLD